MLLPWRSSSCALAMTRKAPSPPALCTRFVTFSMSSTSLQTIQRSRAMVHLVTSVVFVASVGLHEGPLDHDACLGLSANRDIDRIADLHRVLLDHAQGIGTAQGRAVVAAGDIPNLDGHL